MRKIAAWTVLVFTGLLILVVAVPIVLPILTLLAAAGCVAWALVWALNEVHK